MSDNRLILEGLAELTQALRELPAVLNQEAAGIVFGAADQAKDEIVAAYPEHTGNLKSHVTVSHSGGAFGTSAIVKNTAKHAWIFENGTQARHTAIGANRGSMPPGHVFIPIAIRKRREMVHNLAELVRREGFEVTGDL